MRHDALAGARTPRPNRTALGITIDPSAYLIVIQHIAVYNIVMLYASVLSRRCVSFRIVSIGASRKMPQADQFSLGCCSLMIPRKREEHAGQHDGS